MSARSVEVGVADEDEDVEKLDDEREKSDDDNEERDEDDDDAEDDDDGELESEEEAEPRGAESEVGLRSLKSFSDNSTSCS